jgi:hypothetical protein
MCANAAGGASADVGTVVPAVGGEHRGTVVGCNIPGACVQVAKPNCNRRKRKNLALPVIAEKKGDENRVHFSEKVTIIEGTSLFILRTALVLIIHIRTTETCRLWCLNFFVWDTLAAEAPQLPINSDAGGVETGQYHAQGSAGSCD